MRSILPPPKLLPWRLYNQTLKLHRQQQGMQAPKRYTRLLRESVDLGFPLIEDIQHFAFLRT